jgi:hypothetical protein
MCKHQFNAMFYEKEILQLTKQASCMRRTEVLKHQVYILNSALSKSMFSDEKRDFSRKCQLKHYGIEVLMRTDIIKDKLIL